MDFNLFLQEIYNEYNNLNDINLLYFERLKIITIAYRKKIITNIERFKYINTFLYVIEKKINPNICYKINYSEIYKYYDFYNKILLMPYIVGEYSNVQINKLLNNELFKKISSKAYIILYGQKFNLTYCFYIRKIMKLLLILKIHCCNKISYNVYMNNYFYNYNIQYNIIYYNEILKECNNLLCSFYNILNKIFNEIID